jgi:dUTPase
MTKCDFRSVVPVELPPRSETILRIKTPEANENAVILFNPNQSFNDEKNGLLWAASIDNVKDGHIKLCVLNANEDKVILKKAERIGSI